MVNIIVPVLIALFIIRMVPAYQRIINKAKVIRGKTRLRPFDCVKCMSGWICLIMSVYLKTDYVLIIPYMISSMVSGYLGELVYNDITNNITVK